jgi:hypothetical protein
MLMLRMPWKHVGTKVYSISWKQQVEFDHRGNDYSHFTPTSISIYIGNCSLTRNFIGLLSSLRSHFHSKCELQF